MEGDLRAGTRHSPPSMPVILPATRCSLWGPWIPCLIAVAVEFSCSGLRLIVLMNSRKEATTGGPITKVTLTTEVAIVGMANPIRVAWYLSVRYVPRLVGVVKSNSYLVLIVTSANWGL